MNTGRSEVLRTLTMKILVFNSEDKSNRFLQTYFRITSLKAGEKMGAFSSIV